MIVWSKKMDKVIGYPVGYLPLSNGKAIRWVGDEGGYLDVVNMEVTSGNYISPMISDITFTNEYKDLSKDKDNG